MVDFGSGPVLDGNYDFDIDASGDIRTNELDDVDELGKDLAVRIGDFFEGEVLGRQLTDEYKEDLRIQLVLLVREDERVDEVLSLTIEEDTVNNYEMDVDITVDTTDGPYELVIPV